KRQGARPERETWLPRGARARSDECASRCRMNPFPIVPVSPSKYASAVTRRREVGLRPMIHPSSTAGNLPPATPLPALCAGRRLCVTALRQFCQKNQNYLLLAHAERKTWRPTDDIVMECAGLVNSKATNGYLRRKFGDKHVQSKLS